MNNKEMKAALTIAGSDSGGGAGIQADLKTFTALKVFGSSVVTTITAQNTTGVQGIFEVSPEFVEKQLESVLSDIAIESVKTGMLYTADIINVVVNTLTKFNVKKIVIDPVMVSTTGATLLTPEAKDVLLNKLFPMSTIVTPNIPEASSIVGFKIESVDDMKRAAAQIKQQGPTFVLLKGGHLDGNTVIDILFDGTNYVEFQNEKLHKSKQTHGTGCTLSAAICALLAKGRDVLSAVREAEEYVHMAVSNGFESLGKGNLIVLNHFSNSAILHSPLYSKLKAACANEWKEYVHHKFVQQMQDGTLPIDCFQHYIKQDYLFLLHFARANAISCYKTEKPEMMMEATQIVGEILGVEKSLHQKYCESWGISQQELDSTPEATATLAYTRFVLDKGLAGDILDLRVALAPCVCGYGEIGLRLSQDPHTKKDGNPYNNWISMYASEWYQTGVRRAIEQLDQLLRERGDSEERFQSLVNTFKQAIKLEINFWEMGLNKQT